MNLPPSWVRQLLLMGLLVNLWFKWQHLRIARTVAATRKQHEDEESCDLEEE